ncbi:MAG: protein-disulfide reductase DsbD family protein [Vicinamibacterales bacterium]
MTPATAQDPVHWSATLAQSADSARFDVLLTGVVDDDWHVYSVTQGPGGPTPTTVTVAPPFARAGAIRGPEPARAFDPNFDIQTETYDGTFTLRVPVKRTMGAADDTSVTVGVGYQACTDRECLPPRTISISLSLPNSKGQLPTARSQNPTPKEQLPTVGFTRFGASSGSWREFIWLAVVTGALSLLTPCVFPMIPITVSYFTQRPAATARAAIGSAILYGLGIVLTFTVLGGVLAFAAGAAGLNRFAANPWLNLGITALFVGLALNLFGVFEVRLPSGVLSRLHVRSRRSGAASAAGTLLMALTFTITSLTCTAAFLGTLLVVASRGEWQRPLVGLLVYSATFAAPFVLLAAAPQLARHLPRSGTWLGRVKVVMGFLEIAAAMKFLSNADLVWSWGVFTRTAVLVAWIATAAALAVYLFGRRPTIARALGSLTAIIAGVWLASGISGRPLGELEAFLPPPAIEASTPRGGELTWTLNDLDAALAQARRSRQLVFIDFTGYTCTNCRWMEANMFPRPDVRDALSHFVRARLYTDGQGAMFEQQQRFQEQTFQTVALPLYAIVDASGRPIATFAGLTRDSSEFLKFLRAGQ